MQPQTPNTSLQLPSRPAVQSPDDAHVGVPGSLHGNEFIDCGGQAAGATARWFVGVDTTYRGRPHA